MGSLIEFTDAVITTAEDEALYFPPIELADRSYNPDDHLARRHLAGKHDQSTHGKGGGNPADGDYKPGNWRDVKHPVSDSGPPILHEARNGNAQYVERQVVPADQRKEIVETLDELLVSNPPDGRINTKVWIEDIHQPGTLGMTGRGFPVMMIDAKRIREETPEEPGHFMPGYYKGSRTRYLLAHEWGHTIDRRDRPKIIDQHKRLGSGSRYGQRAPEEAYAEAFAEFFTSGGRTSDPVAQAYAKEEGWTA